MVAKRWCVRVRDRRYGIFLQESLYRWNRTSKFNNIDTRIREKVEEKRRDSIKGRVILLDDNGRPHVTIATQQKLCRPLSPSSPDLTLTDYHLLRSLQKYLNGKNFDSTAVIGRRIVQFFESNCDDFYHGILKILQIDQEILYLI